MKELITIWAECIKSFPKKGVFLFIICYFLLRYIAGITFLYKVWNGSTTNSELLEFIKLIMGH